MLSCFACVAGASGVVGGAGWLSVGAGSCGCFNTTMKTVINYEIIHIHICIYICIYIHI